MIDTFYVVMPPVGLRVTPALPPSAPFADPLCPVWAPYLSSLYPLTPWTYVGLRGRTRRCVGIHRCPWVAVVPIVEFIVDVIVEMVTLVSSVRAVKMFGWCSRLCRAGLLIIRRLLTKMCVLPRLQCLMRLLQASTCAVQVDGLDLWNLNRWTLCRCDPGLHEVKL